MLYRVQKEVLVLFFLILIAYPSYRAYRIYREQVKRAVQSTEAISKGIISGFLKDTVASGENEPRDTFRFNLNEVSWEALTLIPGIGENTAKKIITYRFRNGKFRSVEDIMRIKGIGKKTYEKLKPYVYVK